MSTYGEVDLDETPCIFTSCGHIFTIESLDGVMNMAEYYKLDITGMPSAINGPSVPFSYKELKYCPDCRSSLVDIERYGRIVKRAVLDESTKKFVSWSNNACARFAVDIQREQEKLLATRESFEIPKGAFQLDGGLKLTLPRILKIAGNNRRYRAYTSLRERMGKLARQVETDEQPFQRVRELVEIARRRAAPEPGPAEFKFDSTILQTGASLLIVSQGLRLDCIVYNDLAFLWQKLDPTKRPTLRVDFKEQRRACDQLIDAAETWKYPLHEVEGHVLWAQFVAVELLFQDKDADTVVDTDTLSQTAEIHLETAQKLCEKNPAQTRAVAEQVAEARRMLEGLEMRMIVQTMAREFSGTGHWYRCVNNHPFTIGECGMPMSLATCPDCGAGIGGLNHVAVAGVESARDIEEEFGGLHI